MQYLHLLIWVMPNGSHKLYHMLFYLIYTVFPAYFYTSTLDFTEDICSGYFCYVMQAVLCINCLGDKCLSHAI